MRIAVDVMVRDVALSSIVEGAVQAVHDYNYNIILVGNKYKISSELSKYSMDLLPITIKDASKVIGEKDFPVKAFRQKKDVSIMVCSQLIKNGEADALVSAGNSGAIMISALAIFHKLPGILKPAIPMMMPTYNGMCIILDVGANVDCKPINLLQFAIMGKVFIKHVMGKENPTVGLLNVGAEDNKGNKLSRETFKLLKESNINFIGNIEGRDIPMGKADIVVCDGFVGNTILKLTEGISSVVIDWFKEEISNSPLRMFVGWLLRRSLTDIEKKFNFDEYGGAPLLGIKGACIVCHGTSNAKAIKNSIKNAAKYIENNISDCIACSIK